MCCLFLRRNSWPCSRRAASVCVSAGSASLPQDLRGQKSRHVVMLRGRRRVFLRENGELSKAFPVAIGMPGWETHRWTVGRAVSHGCVRLYNEDVTALYRQVSLGTQVTVLP